jgi:hypothetical protein
MTFAPLSEKFSSGTLRRTVAVKMSAVVDAPGADNRPGN